jgi:hypothetical protein
MDPQERWGYLSPTVSPPAVAEAMADKEEEKGEYAAAP